MMSMVIARCHWMTLKWSSRNRRVDTTDRANSREQTQHITTPSSYELNWSLLTSSFSSLPYMMAMIPPTQKTMQTSCKRDSRSPSQIQTKSPVMNGKTVVTASKIVSGTSSTDLVTANIERVVAKLRKISGKARLLLTVNIGSLPQMNRHTLVARVVKSDRTTLISATLEPCLY